jgi:hypothetical protein
VTVGSVCIPVAMPVELCAIDDELKAIYHSADSICVWVFADRASRNRFMEETAGMMKAEREAVFAARYRGAD